MIPCRACKHWRRDTGLNDNRSHECGLIAYGSGPDVVELTDPGALYTKGSFACVLAEPSVMTWDQFQTRIDELDKIMKEKNDGCFVRRCECGHEGCWYEGVLTSLFIRCNEACPRCGSLNKTLEIGLGEEYEL